MLVLVVAVVVAVVVVVVVVVIVREAPAVGCLASRSTGAVRGRQSPRGAMSTLSMFLVVALFDAVALASIFVVLHAAPVSMRVKISGKICMLKSLAKLTPVSP